MLLISKSENKIIAKIITNHSMSLDDAIDLMADEIYEHEPGVWTDDPDYRINGIDCWYDDLDLIADDMYTDSNDVTLADFEDAVKDWIEARKEEYPDEHYELDGEPEISDDLGGIWVQYLRDLDDPEHGAYSLCGRKEDSLDLDIRY